MAPCVLCLRRCGSLHRWYRVWRPAIAFRADRPCGDTVVSAKEASMQRKKLGKQGPEISVVGFGAWEAGGDSYGPNQSEDEVIEAIHAGLDAGIGWIDTAEVYGNGVSERIVGRALQGRRDDVFLATKVGPR